MELHNSFKEKLFGLQSNEFEPLALSVFKYQANHNMVYKRYIECLDVDVNSVQSLSEVPFLPIEFFKHHAIVTDKWSPEMKFLSSGTGNKKNRSSHFVREVDFYHSIAHSVFETFYGPVRETAFFALLPSYVEQGNSSLVSMVDNFISKSQYRDSGFYLEDTQEMINNIQKHLKLGHQVVLFGVTYALLDLAEKGGINLNGLIIIETGGMKGRKKEMTKAELYLSLKSAFNVTTIHSEYGMTELLSQAYSFRDGVFSSPQWMKVIIRDLNDPFHYIPNGKSGGVNVVDLANVDSCSFIETKDIGTLFDDGTFEILGRFDNSDIRGCNLLVS